MAGETPARGRGAQEVEISLPFTERWLVQNSPARRVPSHGTDPFGERYAIDFVGVDDRHRTAGTRDRRTLVATEPPERFVAFGRPVLAPGDGTVVHVQRGSVHVSPGQELVAGQQIARCGNSGNPTQPHVHLQVMDGADPFVARGLPMTSRHFREWPPGPRPPRTRPPRVRERGMPGERAVVEPVSPPAP